jgi:hypothetical protein
MIAITSSALVVIAAIVYPLPIASGGATRATAMPSRNIAASSTATSAATTKLTAKASGGPITAGATRSDCLTPNIPSTVYGLSNVQAAVDRFNSQTHSSVTCLSAYLDNAETWSQWVDPWVANAGAGYSPWVLESPKIRALVLAVNLIPRNLQNTNNPLNWETACDLGQYNSYATQFGNSLVAAGLQNSVLRLGDEMNGAWEPDFTGTTITEQHRWSSCFVEEVSALRRVTGEHFLIDWNPNACIGNYPYANYYPGNKYVDIVGLDLYDVACLTPYTSLTFKQLSSEQLGLNYFMAFAKTKRKPMSLPEWGLSSIPSGDDPAYIDGIGATIASHDFAFETYFDGTGPGVMAINLGPKTPLSLSAFRRWFGSN